MPDRAEGSTSESGIQYYSTSEGVENYYGERTVRLSPSHSLILHGSLRSARSEYGVKKLKEYLNSASLTLDRLLEELSVACTAGELDFYDRVAFVREGNGLIIKLEISLMFVGEPNRIEPKAGYWVALLERVVAVVFSPIGLTELPSVGSSSPNTHR